MTENTDAEPPDPRKLHYQLNGKAVDARVVKYGEARDDRGSAYLKNIETGTIFQATGRETYECFECKKPATRINLEKRIELDEANAHGERECTRYQIVFYCTNCERIEHSNSQIKKR